MTPAPKGSTAAKELAALREQLAALDAECVDLLARRFELARQVGTQKRAAGLAMLDARREAHVIATAAKHARRVGLPEEDVRNIFWQIVSMSRRVQQNDAR
jgi:chorismate mutase